MDCVAKAVPLDPKKTPPIKIEGDENAFLFYVESTGALPPKRIVSEAAKVLDKKASSLNDLVRKGFE
jgi:hypothetical protein